MAYTPELSPKHSCALRRMAWAMNMPMTKTMTAIFDYLSTVMDKKDMCTHCQDHKNCCRCIFYEFQTYKNPITKLITKPLVMITTASGLIDNVMYFTSENLALASLDEFVSTMDWEDHDAALYGPKGLIANAKMIAPDKDPAIAVMA